MQEQNHKVEIFNNAHMILKTGINIVMYCTCTIYKCSMRIT